MRYVFGLIACMSILGFWWIGWDFEHSMMLLVFCCFAGISACWEILKKADNQAKKTNVW